MKNQLFFKIENNEVVNKKLLRQAFDCLKDGGYNLTIESYKKERSNNQNRYYWSGVLPIVKQGLYDVGYREISSVEDAHDMMKFMFLKKNIVNELTGEVKETIGSTTKLSTIEFSEYIDRIAQFASEYLGVIILEANQQLQLI